MHFHPETSCCRLKCHALTTAFISDLNANQHSVVASKREFLCDFYHATRGDAWHVNTHWLSSYSLKHWHGLTCDKNGNVVKMCLPNNNLEGCMPSTIGSLCNLTHLWLDGNKMYGPLPEALGQCFSLVSIQMFTNQISGWMKATVLCFDYTAQSFSLSPPHFKVPSLSLSAVVRIYNELASATICWRAFFLCLLCCRSSI